MLWPWSTIKKLRRELAVEANGADMLATACARHVQTIQNLREQLATAQKNDTRDPSTGRYVKADQS